MRALLVSLGSNGDVFPCLAIGRALSRRGHPVAVATAALHEPEVLRAGLRFVPLPDGQGLGDDTGWARRIQSARTPLAQLAAVYAGLRPRLPGLLAALQPELDAADLVAGSQLLPFLRPLAERHGRRYVSLLFSHQAVVSDRRAPGRPWMERPTPWWGRALFCRLSWRLADLAFRLAAGRQLDRGLEAARLPPVRRFFTDCGPRALVTVSPGLFALPGVGSSYRFVGFCRWQPALDPQSDHQILRFTGGRKVPVLTLGSMAVPDAGRWMERLVTVWPRDQRLIVQAGWAGFTQPKNTPWIRVIDEVPHDVLFASAGLVIHHGGAGTTASALHAGKPQIIVPHLPEQAFWGREMCRLGCGQVLDAALAPEGLPALAARVAGDAGMAQAAANAAQRVVAEDGPAQAAAEMEAWADFPTADRC